MKNETVQYLQKQIRSNRDRLYYYIHDQTGQLYPKRPIFNTIQKHIDAFLNHQSKTRLLILPGFRGVGKTTLMAQLCTQYQDKVTSLFISVEEARHLAGIGIDELMQGFETLMAQDLESMTGPVLFFLDEVQSDPTWAIALKTLFDRTHNIFFCCTGSAAVLLQSTPDLARRCLFQKMLPLNFSEYALIKHQTTPPEDVTQNLHHALFYNESAKQVFDELHQLKPLINQFWSQVDHKQMTPFLCYGTLPFTLTMTNDIAIYDAISLLIDKIIDQDLPLLGHFEHSTLKTTKQILSAIADSDSISVQQLSETLGINKLTLTSLLSALEQAEVLFKIPAMGSNMTAAKKSAKYLFACPAIRMSLLYLTGHEGTFLTRQGALLEDLVSAYLQQQFILPGQGIIRYDAAQRGADFIVQLFNRKQIIIEVGRGHKTTKQIEQTARKINSNYNLVIAEQELQLDSSCQTVFVPWEYFLLL